MQAMLDPIIKNRVENKIEESDMLNDYIRVWTNENVSSIFHVLTL